MKCQSCNKNESDLTISIKYKQHSWDLHLCEECAGTIQRFLEASGTEYQRKLMEEGRQEEIPALLTNPQFFSGVAGSRSGLRRNSVSSIPEDAGEEIRFRRRKNQLETLLHEAVGKEAYEEAARLRDSLKQLEKGVLACEQQQ